MRSTGSKDKNTEHTELSPDDYTCSCNYAYILFSKRRTTLLAKREAKIRRLLTANSQLLIVVVTSDDAAAISKI
jgi:hypothetical protein